MDHDNLRRAQALLELLYAAGDNTALRRYAKDKSIDPDISVYAAGLLLRPWLPWGAGRRVLMLLISTLVVALAMGWGSYLPLVFLIVPALFSPRLAGEVLTAVGRLSRG